MSGGVGGFVSPTKNKLWGEGFVLPTENKLRGEGGERMGVCFSYEKQALGAGVCFSYAKQTLRGGTVCFCYEKQSLGMIGVKREDKKVNAGLPKNTPKTSSPTRTKKPHEIVLGVLKAKKQINYCISEE